MVSFPTYTPPVFGITGWKNSGKTRLTTRLISHFAAQGMRVGAIKHAHHAFDVDHQGRDSFKMREAGARQVAIISRHRFALMRELEPEPEPAFEEILDQFEGFDLVLIEGYKELPFPKIETRSQLQETRQRLADGRPDIVAIASDEAEKESRLPVFSPEDIDGIGAFIVECLRLKRESERQAR